MNNTSYHKSVLTAEVLEYLSPKKGGLYVDATFGGGGHTRALLEHEPTCSVIAIDWDKQSLELNGPQLLDQFPDRLTLLWGNFAQLYQLLKKSGVNQVDGILADLGTSQYQLRERAGFSFQHDTALDMRMSPAHQKTTAAEIINKSSAEKLRQIFWQLGEEPYAKQIVNVILEERKKSPIQTTGQLTEIVKRAVPVRRMINPATQVFQALRMYINHELDNLHAFLPAALRVLNHAGRAVVISFHSLEDRMVKQYFIDAAHEGIVNILTPKAITATEQERAENSAARSAKLRAVERR